MTRLYQLLAEKDLSNRCEQCTDDRPFNLSEDGESTHLRGVSWRYVTHLLIVFTVGQLRCKTQGGLGGFKLAIANSFHCYGAKHKEVLVGGNFLTLFLIFLSEL